MTEWPRQEHVARGIITQEKFHTKNLFVKHLPIHFTNVHLTELFSPFGEIVSARIVVEPRTGKTKGYGFVWFATSEAAHSACTEMHGKSLPPNKTLHVEPALLTRGNPRNSQANNSLYITQLPKQFTKEELQQRLSAYGPVTRCKLLCDALTGAPSGVAIVQFATAASAMQAKTEENGKRITPESAPLMVRFAETHETRQTHKRAKTTHKPVRSSYHPSSSLPKPVKREFDDKVDGGINLFVFHLPESYTDSHLQQLFAPYGAIESAKVMVHLFGERVGESKGFGFVKFRDAAEGVAAMTALNKHKIGKRTLHVNTKKSD